MTHTGISVVIPNYNGGKLLPEILPCLYEALQRSGLPYEIIISDDCSTDNTVEWLQNNHPDIRLVINHVNRGFAPTINAGIQQASFSWVLLLNSDVKLEPDYFLPLMRYMTMDDCFGVMGKIIGWNNDEVQDGGKYPSRQGFKIKTDRNFLPINPDEPTPLYSMYLSGANAFVNREKLMNLGGFDELFAPFYVEDYELSLRAWRLGWKCYYENKAVCRHQTSVTIKNLRKKTQIKIIYNRNKFLLHAIHLRGLRYFCWWLQLTMELIFRMLIFQFHFVSSFILFLGAMKAIRHSRKKLQQLAENENRQLKDVRMVMREIEEALDKQAIRLC